MVSIKDAANLARKYLTDILGDVGEVRLEEVDSQDGQWLITLSFPAGDGTIRSYLARRTYKVMTIDKNSGEVTSMKIRVIQDA